MARIHLSVQASYLVVILLSGVVSAMLAMGAWARVSPLTLGIGLTAWLGAMSLYLLRRPPSGEAPPRWRDVMPCYLSIQDRELKILETNHLFREDFGDRVGERCFRVYKDRTSPCPNCPVLKTLEDGENHSSEETVVTRDGRVAHVVVTSAPFHDRHGELTGVVEMSTNVTEIKALQDELDRERRAFQNFFDIVPCTISIQDRSYRIEQTNQLFRDNFGNPVGSCCYEVIKGRDAICPDCPVERTFEDGQVHSSEETAATPEGEATHMIVQSMPVHDDQGNVRAAMRVATDITEVKKLQHRLSLMGLAVAGMAHRIKNILMGLEGGIFVVNTGFEMEEPETVNEGWGMVERNVAKISRTVKDLLYCSKTHEAGFKAGLSPADVMEEVHELYLPRTEKEGIELLLDLPEQRLTGTYDPDGLFKLLTNLVANALDACLFDPSAGEKRHRISMRCSHHNNDTELEVADNGVGIPDDVHHKVFENFFSTKGTEGTGLGLLVVQKVAEEHGGTVSFTSEKGQGTTFRVVLPARSS